MTLAERLNAADVVPPCRVNGNEHGVIYADLFWRHPLPEGVKTRWHVSINEAPGSSGQCLTARVEAYDRDGNKAWYTLNGKWVNSPV